MLWDCYSDLRVAIIIGMIHPYILSPSHLPIPLLHALVPPPNALSADLLEQYSQDQAAIAALSQQADSLESELDDLIVTFTDAERRLQQCYKTP